MALVTNGAPTKPAHAGAATALTGRPAREFLLAMAVKARHGGATGRYYCSDITQGTRGLVGAHDTTLSPPWLDGSQNPSAAPPAGYRYAIFGRYRTVDCTKPSNTSYHAVASQDLGARPAGPADAAAWRRDGSPDHWGAWYAHQIESAHAGPTTYSQFTKGGTEPWGRSDVSLPADPAKLKAVFDAHPLAGHPSQREQLMTDALNVMKDPVSPAVHGAALAVLAGVPGVRMAPGLADPEGQKGTAVWWNWAQSGPEQQIILIDPATGTYLADETIAATQIGGAPPGTVLDYTVFSYHWTDRLPPIPAKSKVQHSG